MKSSVLLLLLTDTICGRAIGRCNSDADCSLSIVSVEAACEPDNINCQECGDRLTELGRNRHGLSVLLCQQYTGSTQRARRNFLEQCTNYFNAVP